MHLALIIGITIKFKECLQNQWREEDWQMRLVKNVVCKDEIFNMETEYSSSKFTMYSGKTQKHYCKTCTQCVTVYTRNLK